MGVVHPADRQETALPLEHHRLVEQHPDAEMLEADHDLDRIMVPENPENPVAGPDPGNQPAHPLERRKILAPGQKPEIAGHHAEIDLEPGYRLGQSGPAIDEPIDMEIGQVKDGEPFERLGKIVEQNLPMPAPEVERIPPAPLVLSAQAKDRSHQNGQPVDVLGVEAVGAESPVPVGGMVDLQIQPAAQQFAANPLFQVEIRVGPDLGKGNRRFRAHYREAGSAAGRSIQLGWKTLAMPGNSTIVSRPSARRRTTVRKKPPRMDW